VKKYLSWGLLTYIKFLAKLALFIHKPKVIGIAGSVGKTSTRNALYAGLKDLIKVKLIEGNSETGVPLGILGLEPESYTFKDWFKICLKAPLGLNYIKGFNYLIIEMGIDDPNPPKNMSYLLTIVKPDIAISLNASAAHTQQFEKALPNKSMTTEERYDLILKAIAKEDTQIITKSDCKFAIYNNDDPYIVESITPFIKNNQTIKFLNFGQTNNATITLQDYSVNTNGTFFSFAFKNQSQALDIQFPNVIMPEVYKDSLSAVLLTGLALNLNMNSIATSLTDNLQLPNGRSSIFKGINKSYLIDSSYNASKSSMLAFLDLMQKLNTNNQPIVVVFGDMRELGNEAEMEHQEVARKIIEVTDYCFCVGVLTQKYVMPIIENKLIETKWFPIAITAGKYLAKHLPMNSLVLIKGSQNEIFLEEVTSQLLLDRNDRNKLCRQSDYWLKRKNHFFTSKLQN